MVRVLVLATGGTIFQAAGSDGKMQLKLSPAELLAQSSAHLGDLELELLDLQVGHCKRPCCIQCTRHVAQQRTRARDKRNP